MCPSILHPRADVQAERQAAPVKVVPAGAVLAKVVPAEAVLGEVMKALSGTVLSVAAVPREAVPEEDVSVVPGEVALAGAGLMERSERTHCGLRQKWRPESVD